MSAATYAQHQSYSQPNNNGTDPAQQPSQADDQQYITTFFCRALYDYQSADDSSLSFRKNDVIEVLTQLETGWWDGLLGDERGWFPSNYVVVISDEEADVAFAASELQHAQQQGYTEQEPIPLSQSTSTLPSMTTTSTSSTSRSYTSQDQGNWLEGEVEFVPGRGAPEDALTVAARGPTQSSDFWVPQVTPDGQIYYVNTQTGQQSRDLPTEAEDELSDADFAAPQRSRSGSTAGTVYGRVNGGRPTNGGSAGFGIPKRSGTPEPWVRKLADDGLTYFYQNKLDGTVQWTAPDGAGAPRSNGHATVNQYKDPATRKREPETTRLHSQSSASYLSRSRSGSTSGPGGVYSDDSDVDVIDRSIPRSTNRSQASSGSRTVISRQPSSQNQSLNYGFSPGDLTAAEKSALALQASLAPPTPESLTDLSGIARQAVSSVISFIQAHGVSGREEEHRALEGRILDAVVAIRNLLSISSPPHGHISSSLYPKNVPTPESSAALQAMQAQLKPAQRRVTATLSKLVLAALAAQYDSNSFTSDAAARMEADAAELDRALVTGQIRRLRVQTVGQSSIASLQSLLEVISSINLSQTIDIDGMGGEGRAFGSDAYMQSVQRARALVRSVEAAVQALFDEGTSLFLAVQGYCSPRAPSAGSDDILSLSSFLKTDATTVLETFEMLLLIGQEQADKGQNDYRGSIDWRASRLLSLDPSISQTLGALSSFEEAEYDEADDVVGWELAIMKPKAKAFNPSDSLPDSIPNNTPVDIPEITIGSNRPRGASNVVDPSWKPAQHQQNDSIASITPPPSGGGSDDTMSLFPEDEVTVGGNSMNAVKSPSRADKLIRMLGDAPTHIIDKLNAEQKPWYLRPNYSETEIIIDPDGKVRGGTVQALVERLTAHEHSDTTFTKTFLMTYKSFTDLDTLFDLLAQRFWIQPPDGLNEKEMEEWKKLKQHIIRTRVLNTLKTMITDDDALDKDDMYILDRMKEMVTREEVVQLAAGKQLLALIERAQRGDNPRAKTTISLDPSPPVIQPRSSKKLKLLDFDPLETARQLTILECQLFMKIKASECLTRSREQKVTNDNIAAAIETTNKIAHWVADTVLDKEDSRKRALIMKHFISVADRCRELRNFSSMIAIVSGLNSPPIRRLKRTWEQISQKFMSMLGNCEMTIDSGKNFNNYRQLLQRITPPCVPFIGVYLTTLTFIQDGAPNNISGNLVNFRKRMKAAEVIQEIQKWQSKPFNFHRVDAIYGYIEESLNKFNDVRDVSDVFWNRSLEREPREREDEKMARLLQETGFL
ncbi:ras guanine nucleotide exchange factor domain-containing protein [Amylostereum chailletii]|nr:ras guanine nucleotide exchange factor domain-containing protein [Amylostereum chailletii]